MATKTQERVTCHECGEDGAIGNMYKLEVYDTPWETEPRTIYVHKFMPQVFKDKYKYDWRESCEELLTDSGWADFRYFDCPFCDRMIYEQNPRNGWHSQYRMRDGEQICLKCFETDILENGIEREEFENGKLKGMFFSGDNHEPLDAGYAIDERVNNTRGDSTDKSEEICAIALAHIDAGRKVIIGYESMAIGRLEEYVTLFYKEA